MWGRGRTPGPTHTQLLTSGPSALGERRPEQRLDLAAAQQLDLLPLAGSPPASSRGGAGRRQPVRDRQQRVRLDRERPAPGSARTSPCPRVAPPRRTPRGAPAEHARSRSSSTRGRTRPSANGSPSGRRPARTARGSPGAREVDAGDVQPRLQRAQADAPAADVQHARPRCRPRQREEVLVARRRGAGSERGGQPRRAARGRWGRRRGHLCHRHRSVGAHQ